MGRIALGCVVLCVSGITRAQPLAPAATPVPAPLPTWLPSGSIRGELGYRDNVLLSTYAPLGRTFARTEAEAMLARLPEHGWEFLAFLNADVLRYLSPPKETKGEQQWFLHTAAHWQPSDRWHFGLTAQGYYQDLVVDLSETEAVRVVAPTRVQGGIGTLDTTVKLPGGFTLEPSVRFQRCDYKTYVGDFDETRAGGRLTWSRSPHFTAEVAWYDWRRPFADRTQFTAGGRPRAGTHLTLRQRETEAKVSTTWEGGGQWTAAATVGGSTSRDGSSGYFDYNEERARLELGWSLAKWKLSIDGRAKRLDYLGQTVGIGIAPPPRLEDQFEARARVEHQLGGDWMVFVEHTWERTRCNEPTFDHRAKTTLAGIEKSF